LTISDIFNRSVAVPVSVTAVSVPVQ
jgi:hypothetical protein